MKRKIKNIFGSWNHHCFACSPQNPIGLKMDFYEEGEWIISEWQPHKNYEGYPAVLHGGIQSTLLDEISAWAVYVHAKTCGVTSRMSIKYKKEVSTLQHKIIAKARIREIKRNLCYIEAQLLAEDETLCAEAEVTYFLFPAEDMVAKGYYPADPQQFFD